MNILVYAGEGTLATSTRSLLGALRSRLGGSYAVQSISYGALTTQPWATGCSLLVIPRFSTPSHSLREAQPSISKFVSSGGSLLAIAQAAQSLPITHPEPQEPSLTLSKADNGIASLQLLSGDVPTFQRRIQTNDGQTFPIMCPQNVSNFGASQDAVVLGKDIEKDIVFGLLFGFGAGRVVVWNGILDHIDEEEGTNRLWNDTLDQLGLAPRIQGNETEPLPQFLISPPPFTHATARLSSLLYSPCNGFFEDSADTFQLHAMRDADKLLDPKRSPADKSVKSIILCEDGRLPPKEMTPLFDVESYFSALGTARLAANCLPAGGYLGIGHILLYGQAVTSTQTMLVDNPAFHSILPCPLVSIASHQLRGRGRGGNVWISPSGCLQFTISLLVSLSLIPAYKLVFIQYLFSLAVVEACRETSIAGIHGDKVRIKWPNDIYILDEGGKKKIGGVLVNTSFSGDNAIILIGCGLNVLTPSAIPSLAQLLGFEAGLRLEVVAATIFAKFDTMWSKFILDRGSFQSFSDLYHSRWLHSGEIVKVTSSVPPMTVKVDSITLDYGLLRTIPISDENRGFIDLQPDGNSFDIFAGLIKLKN